MGYLVPGTAGIEDEERGQVTSYLVTGAGWTGQGEIGRHHSVGTSTHSLTLTYTPQFTNIALYWELAPGTGLVVPEVC